MSTSLSRVPLHLLSPIFSRLPPYAVQSICNACRDFGRQPTGELVTRLIIAITQLSFCRNRVVGRTDRFSNVTSITIGAAVHNPSADRATMQLVLFVVGQTPTMPHLGRLHLHGLPLTTVIAASACLGNACPHLSYIKLHGLLRDGYHSAPDLYDLWRALATVPSLRRLKVTGSTYEVDTGLPGLGGLVHLERLNVDHDGIQLPDLSRLLALTKLVVGQVMEVPQHPPDVGQLEPVRLTSLTRLRSLTLTEVWQDVSAFTPCTALTSLAVHSWDFLGDLWDEVLEDVCLSALVRLDAAQTDVHPTQLLVLPSLRELRCSGIYLPVAGTCLVFPQLRVLQCAHFQSPWDDDADDYLPSQSLAKTFPSLESLQWIGTLSEIDEHMARAELWPAPPAQQLGTLRFLLTSMDKLGPSLARCASSVERLRLAWWHGGSGDSVASHMPRMRTRFPHLLQLELHVSGADRDLAAVVDCWPRLRDVTLSYLDGASDVGLVALSRLSRLRRVVLDSCRHVTPGGVAALARTWSVEVIQVWACHDVSAASVRQVQGLLGRPQLDIAHSVSPRKVAPWCSAHAQA